MKKRILAFWLACTLIPSANAQIFKGLQRKIKEKVEERINKSADENADSGLDIIERKNSEKKTTGSNAQESITAGSKTILSSYSKFDFVPGDKIIYLDDFSKEQLGELPTAWNASGKGEIVTIVKNPGKFLRLFPGTKYLSGNTKSFGEIFTVEFDLIMDGIAPSGTRFFPELAIGVFAAEGKSGTDNKFLDLYPSVNNVTEILLKPNVDGNSTASIKSKGEKNATTFESKDNPFKDYSASFGRSAHYAIQVQGSRLRFWVDGHKVFDLPRAVNKNPALNQLYLNCSKYWFYDEHNFGLYVTNFKIATGIIPQSETLLSKGRYSTSGILFDTNSNRLKPQSMGIINEISKFLNDNATVNLQIIGYTDADGDAAANEKLSLGRANTVREVLIREFNVDAGRLTSLGKGETVPLNDNKSDISKALNRRVEFVKN